MTHYRRTNGPRQARVARSSAKSNPSASFSTPTTFPFLAALALIASAACSGKGTSIPRSLQSVEVAPPNASVPAGLTQSFTAVAVWSDGAREDVSAAAAWTTADPSIAVANGNVVTGRAIGSTDVLATVQGVTGTAPLAVTAPVVQAVTVSPAGAYLAAGFSRQYSATAVYSDTTKQDVTRTATWSSSNGAAATIGTTGRALGVAAGSTGISAAFSGVTGSAPLTVTSATLTSISISPTAPSVPMDVTNVFAAIGIFSDGTNADLTSQVAWTSDAAAVATISSSGVATPAGSGTATIGASLGGVSASTTLTVSGATLAYVSVLPATATIAAGTWVALEATGTYSDGTTQDLAPWATWTSSDPSVTVSGAGGTRVAANGVSAGSATVTAARGGFSDSANVTVTGAVLASIAITPSGATVPAGAVRQLVATGTFSDGSRQDLTAGASWTSSDPAVANASNAAGTQGLVTALAQGTVTITAGFAGVRATAPLTVAGVTLSSIQVLPASASLPAGYALPFTATATYSDKSTADVTTLATWASSNTLVATVSNATGAQGLATGVSPSATPVLVTATFGGMTGSASLTVTSTKLASIAVTPSTFSVAVGAVQQMVATGTFQDGTVLDITDQCAWSSSPRSVARVSKGGAVTGVATGSVTITAKRSGKSGTASGTVL